ncbi:MAG TPA: M48 family metallopeptidase [Candidatus Acidoferrales bacterium]|nr:M48 family metallopeptidase [Candidatus Acidoferrales bacterium]
MGRHTKATAVLLAAALALPAWAQKNKDVERIGERDINKGSVNLYSLEREIALGQQLSSQVEASSRLLRDSRVQGFVDDVVQNLVRNSDSQVPFTVKIIDSDEVNAFALPGGYLYVNTGLILEAETESELAGVLAHEIAHVTARHTTKQASKRTLMELFSLPLIFVGGPVGYGIQQAMGLAVPLAFLKFSRNAEREADYLGLQYTYEANYDPTALVDFLERMAQQDRSRVPTVFSSHPMTKDRIQRAQSEIAAVLPTRPEHVVSTSRFESVKGYLQRIQRANWVYAGAEEGPKLRRRTDAETSEKKGGDKE